MLRNLVKSGLAWGLEQAGIGRRRSPFVVGYHRTTPEFPADPKTAIPSQCISVKMLERQLDWIGQRFRFVSLNELGRELKHDSSDPVAAVTFDDGYQDFYQHAFPLLKRKGIPATVFVVTDLIGTTELHIHDRLYLLLARSMPTRDAHASLESMLATRPQAEVLRWILELEGSVTIDRDIQREHRSLSWEEIAEIRKAGITIGSHTRTHAILPNEDTGKVGAELRGAREALEERLGEPVRHFAYPCGQFNAATIEAVEQAGYEFAYTICEHRANRSPALTIPRKLLWENSCLNALGSFSSAIMSGHANGSFDLFAGCRLNHGGVLCWS
jgi:peptidoglycan/xylan/chitin deacetylase (PgdA/CDA1 family)